MEHLPTALRSHPREEQTIKQDILCTACRAWKRRLGAGKLLLVARNVCRWWKTKHTAALGRCCTPRPGTKLFGRQHPMDSPTLPHRKQKFPSEDWGWDIQHLRKKYCHETGGKARAERKPLSFFSGKPLRKTFWIFRHRSGPAFCSISFKATPLC